MFIDKIAEMGMRVSPTADGLWAMAPSRLKAVDVAIVEATSPGQPFSHLGWEQAHALRDRHPGTRFLFVHIYEGTLDGAVADLEVVDV